MKVLHATYQLFHYNRFVARHAKILFLRTVPTNSKVFLRGLLNMREEQILASVIEIQKENWG